MNTDIVVSSGMNNSLEVKPIEIMIRVMDAEELHYRRNEDTITARFPMNGVITNLSMRFTERTIFFSVSYNIRTPAERCDEMLHFINASNWELVLGNLEMDPEDGEVKLRYTYRLDSRLLGDDYAGVLLFGVLSDAHKCSAGVMAVLTGSDKSLFDEEDSNDDQE